VTTAIIALLLIILISLWIGFYQLVKQQGRILLRLDKLEAAAQAPDAAVHHDHAAHEPRSDDFVGTEFPAFKFPDLAGKTVALADFRGKQVLLVNWNFDCGFCDLIAPELARLHSTLDEQNVQLLLLSYGDAASNRKQANEHGLKCPILLPKGNERPKPFAHEGTPVAYLLDETGQVARHLASGADEVVGLAKQLSVSQAAGSDINSKSQRKKLQGERSLNESRIERNGLKAGTPAPLFRLPDLAGKTISLDEYRGRQVLLVFSDPQCGPCDELAPQLARLHQEHGANDLALLLVGRGDPEENRRKAAKFGIKFPVVLQEKWKLSKEYGIFATPVAFLIDAKGVIAQDVAVGKDAILDLANAGLKATNAMEA
jgi:peroxiredoxin